MLCITEHIRRKNILKFTHLWEEGNTGGKFRYTGIRGENPQNDNPLKVQREMARGVRVRCGLRDKGTNTLHPGSIRES